MLILPVIFRDMVHVQRPVRQRQQYSRYIKRKGGKNQTAVHVSTALAHTQKIVNKMGEIVDCMSIKKTVRMVNHSYEAPKHGTAVHCVKKWGKIG